MSLGLGNLLLLIHICLSSSFFLKQTHTKRFNIIWIQSHLHITGAIPPLLVLLWRLKMEEPKSFQIYSMKRIPLKAYVYPFFLCFSSKKWKWSISNIYPLTHSHLFRYPWRLLFRNFGIPWAGLCLGWFIYGQISSPPSPLPHHHHHHHTLPSFWDIDMWLRDVALHIHQNEPKILLPTPLESMARPL